MKWAAVRGGFAVMLALAGAALGGAAGPVVTPAMVGHWHGEAKVIVSWCRQQALPVALEVHADGTVTGRIGDAGLVHGRLLRNRGWFGRKFNLATDYLVKGDLDGAVVAAEGITRASVSLPLNFSPEGFSGSVHTSGTKVGGKETMILSASGLKLKRT